MPYEHIFFTKPPYSLFKFPADIDPTVLASPPARSSPFAPPFTIPQAFFRDALDVRVPITIAAVYAVTVQILNRYNRSRGNKPWAISKWKSFFWFVVAHNVLLAVYSAWTFVGMWTALRRSVQSPLAPAGWVGTVDSLCKMHGAAGLGSAVAYSPESSAWVSQSSSVLLGATGAPQPTDTGRLWNEGLAFYGWFFYLSKFYEVLDTVIILAKGKRSSTLQTYHHAGAMMCMWAGIRYMSPPIWMFCFVNSGIHALMYTYYTLTAFSIPIPTRLKKSLTTMQIIQFLVGVSFAMIHSFISYTIPVQVPIIPAPTASSVSSAIASATAAGLVSAVKKLLFRAVGEEGLAENVHASSITSPSQNLASGAVQYRTEYQTIPCIDTSGQTFGIWLNVFYLAPLTVLFMRFFVKSYLRMAGGGKKSGKVEKAGGDALKGVERVGGVTNGSLVNGNGKANGKANGYANGKANGHATNEKTH